MKYFDALEENSIFVVQFWITYNVIIVMYAIVEIAGQQFKVQKRPKGLRSSFRRKRRLKN